MAAYAQRGMSAPAYVMPPCRTRSRAAAVVQGLPPCSRNSQVELPIPVDRADLVAKPLVYSHHMPIGVGVACQDATHVRRTANQQLQHFALGWQSKPVSAVLRQHRSDPLKGPARIGWVAPDLRDRAEAAAVVMPGCDGVEVLTAAKQGVLEALTASMGLTVSFAAASVCAAELSRLMLLSDTQHYFRLNDPAHPLSASQFINIPPATVDDQFVCGVGQVVVKLRRPGF
jgi:hypothetical protein